MVQLDSQGLKLVKLGGGDECRSRGVAQLQVEGAEVGYGRVLCLLMVFNNTLVLDFIKVKHKSARIRQIFLAGFGVTLFGFRYALHLLFPGGR